MNSSPPLPSPFDPSPWKVLSSNVGAGVLTGGWNLAEVEAETQEIRSFVVEVVFDAPFAAPPVVHLGLTGFDMDERDSSRLTLRAENIGPSGFQVRISTWAGTRVYAAEFSWLAIGG